MSENERQLVHSSWGRGFFVISHALGIPTLLTCADSEKTEVKCNAETGMVVLPPFLCSKLTLQIISLVTCLPFKENQDQEAGFPQSPVGGFRRVIAPGPFLHPIPNSASVAVPEMDPSLQQPGKWLFTELWSS